MFNRSILIQLKEWKNSPHRKPMILRGARQVGKTTIVNALSREYDNFLSYNLEIPEHLVLFESANHLPDFIVKLFAFSGKPRKNGSTLVFIDEIQNSPKTISLLRYFYEEYPEIHVIAAGSLLENIVDIKFSFPVGRVQYLPVRPCSFAEFAVAVGGSRYTEILYDRQLATISHDRLMDLFNQYLIVGGMPEVVQVFSERRDILAANDIYETLLQAYRDDVEKYVRGNKLSETVRFILERGWYKAAETISLGNFAGSAYKTKDVGEAFRLLQKAMLLELVYPATSTDIPILTETKRRPKLIWLDTGLVNYAAGIRNEIVRSQNILDVWKGRIAEHIVAQELLTLNNKISQRRAFWIRGKGGESAEVDFLWTVDSKIIPIEVKAGHNSRLRSLHSFIDRSQTDVAIRIWSNPLSVDDVITVNGKKKFRLINLPFYMIGHLEDIVREYI